MRQQQRQQGIARFVAGRARQTDGDFVADCRVAAFERGPEIALAVRRSVAHSCGVEPEFIRAADGFSHELYLLWDEDSLDAVGFFMDLEERLGVEVTDRDAERITPPFSGQRTVGDLVRNVCEVVGRPSTQ